MQAHRVVEAMLEAVADAVLLALEAVEAGIADIEVPVEEGPVVGRQEAGVERVEIAALRIALVEARDRQARIARGLPGQPRRDAEPLLLDVVVARVGEAADDAEAVRELALTVDRPLAGEAALDPAMAATR